MWDPAPFPASSPIVVCADHGDLMVLLLFPVTGEQGVWVWDTILAKLLMRETWFPGKVSEQFQRDMKT